MAFEKKRFATLLLVILSTLVLASCGGGGSGSSAGSPPSVRDSFTLSDMSGTYRLGHMEFGPESSTTLMDVTWDGSGNYLRSNIYPFAGPEAGVYTLASDGTINVDGAMAGQLSMDANTFHLVDTHLDDGRVSFSIGLKKGASMAASDISGDFHVFVLFASTYDLGVMRFNFNFDGIGDSMFTSITQPGNNGEFEYTVSANGELSLYDSSTDDTSYGQVDPDGEAFFIVGNRNVLTIGIKASAGGGMTNAGLSGIYHGISIEDRIFSDMDDTFNSLQTSRFEVDADGSSAVIVTGIENSSGGLTAIETVDNVTVSSTGIMNVQDEYIGQLCSDFGMFIISDDPIADDDSKIIFGIVKP